MREFKYKQMVEEAGGIWIGLQEGFENVPALICFMGPKSKSTIGIWEDEVSVENIKNKLKEK